MALNSKSPLQLLIILIGTFYLIAGNAVAAKRVALVIGNSAYTTVPKLNTPQNDAIAIGAAITRLGFEVITGFDLDERQMLKTFSQFQRKLNTADYSSRSILAPRVLHFSDK